MAPQEDGNGESSDDSNPASVLRLRHDAPSYASSSLQAFYAKHGVDLAAELDAPPPKHRFVRLNPRHDRTKTLAELKVRLADACSLRRSSARCASPVKA